MHVRDSHKMNGDEGLVLLSQGIVLSVIRMLAVHLTCTYPAIQELCACSDINGEAVFGFLTIVPRLPCSGPSPLSLPIDQITT